MSQASMSQAKKAAIFRSLHAAGSEGLLLPNAWDAASARIFEVAGFPAVATTSAGVAYSRGFRDGQHIGRNAMIAEIANIVRAVEIPVTADIEAGYGPLPSDVTETVRGVIEAGAAGINLEDNAQGTGRDEPLFTVAEQVARIEAARRRSASAPAW